VAWRFCTHNRAPVPAQYPLFTCKLCPGRYSIMNLSHRPRAGLGLTALWTLSSGMVHETGFFFGKRWYLVHNPTPTPDCQE
jgi:hypothetical protein